MKERKKEKTFEKENFKWILSSRSSESCESLNGNNLKSISCEHRYRTFSAIIFASSKIRSKKKSRKKIFNRDSSEIEANEHLSSRRKIAKADASSERKTGENLKNFWLSKKSAENEILSIDFLARSLWKLKTKKCIRCVGEARFVSCLSSLCCALFSVSFSLSLCLSSTRYTGSVTWRDFTFCATW